MRARRLPLALFLAVSALATTSVASVTSAGPESLPGGEITASLEEVPEAALDNLEPAVRAKLESLRATVDRLENTAGSGDLGRARAYADLYSRVASMYDNFLAQEIIVPD